MLTRDQIAAVQLPREEVTLEDLGGSVFVRALSGRQFLKVIAGVRDGSDDLADLLIPYLSACVLDAEGNPILVEEDLDRLPFSVLAKLVSRLAVISGLQVDGEVEEGKGD